MMEHGYLQCSKPDGVTPGVHYVTGNFAKPYADAENLKMVVATSTMHPQVLAPTAAALVQGLDITDGTRRQFLQRVRILQKITTNQ